MRKLQLRLDDLAVESFAAAAPCSPRGTAHAHGALTDPVREEPGGDTAAPPCFTCEMSCPAGCPGGQ